MGFIEDERRRRDSLVRGNALDTPAKKVERERLLRATAELKREEFYAKSEAYFGESFTPKLVDQLSEVVGGTVSRDEHGFFSDLKRSYDTYQKGEIWLRLSWDEEEIFSPLGNSRWDTLARRHPEIRSDPGQFFISKSVDIVFSPRGSIRFNGAYLNGISGSSEIVYQQWKGKRGVEEASLQKAFRNPGEHLRRVSRPQSEGVPTSERAGPGSL